jgi:diguanylate cyclase (GGDEF)-like protein
MHRLLRTGANGGSGDARGVQARGEHGGEAVVIVDVDQFPEIRARHGASGAEQVTRAVADALQRRLRGRDRLALLRDEEFLAVLAGVPAEAVGAIVERLRGDVQALRLALGGDVWRLSCTIGSAARQTRPCPLEALVRAADADLHRARRAQLGAGAGATRSR